MRRALARRERDRAAAIAAAKAKVEAEKAELKALRMAIESLQCWVDEGGARRHLKRIGPADGLELLRKLFGRAAVDKAFRAGGGLPASKGREYMVWLTVELRRAATEATAKDACARIAKNGGIRGWRETRRGERREETLTTAATIQRIHVAAVRGLKDNADKRGRWTRAAQLHLIAWRESGLSYDRWERQQLAKPGWRYRP